MKSKILALAPMEGVTDIVFRQVVAHADRPDLFFTEFTNVSSFASEKGRHDALSRLEISETDPPIIAQIWGKNPDHFSELASALKSMGFAGIDLNFGCPDRHVNRAGGGAAMIRTPELAVECIRRAKEASNGLPVSVKTRLGFTYLEERTEWLKTLLKESPSTLTVHLRTRKEMSKVPAHYELIPEIISLRSEFSPETKIFINGDIKNRSEALTLAEKYPELDGFMIGRGVFQNPFCFKETPDGSPYSPTNSELLELFRFHLDIFDKENKKREERGEKPFAYEPLKHFFKVYIKDFPGASELRTKLIDCKNTDELRKTLDYSIRDGIFRP